MTITSTAAQLIAAAVGTLGLLAGLVVLDGSLLRGHPACRPQTDLTDPPFPRLPSGAASHAETSLAVGRSLHSRDA